MTKHDLTNPYFMSNPLLVVESMLTDEEERVFLDNFYALNPNMRGAQVADILDMLESSDSHLDVTEPVMHEFLVYTGGVGRLSQLFDLCIYAAIYIRRDPTEGSVPLAKEIYSRIPAEALQEPVLPS